MTLYQEIQTKCTEAEIAERNFHVIAAKVSVGRKEPNGVTIGNGSLLETLGLATGNIVLDLIAATPDYRHVKPLLEQGRLIAASPLVAAAVQGMVAGGVLTQGQGDAVIALGFNPAPVSWQQCATAFEENGV